MTGGARVNFIASGRQDSVSSVQILTMKGDPIEPQIARKAIDVMARQVGHLGRLVDDLLDISPINQDRIELRREPVDVGQVARDALESLGRKSPINIITLKYAFRPRK